mgnify:CR=1 FL=1
MGSEKELTLPPLRAAVGAPLWLQLKHALRDLATFELRPGDRIPTEPDLCRHYGLSRITVRQAVTSLVDEGLLKRQQGRGTFVLAARLPQHLGDADHFLNSGFDAEPPEHVKLFSAEPAPAPDWLAHKLGITAGSDVFKIRKVLALSAEPPAAFRTTFITASLAPNLLRLNLSAPMYNILERDLGMAIVSADEIIEFILADEFRASMLSVPVGHPLILVERISYLDSGAPVDCSRAYYRADRFRFEHRLQRCGNPQRSAVSVM